MVVTVNSVVYFIYVYVVCHACLTGWLSLVVYDGVLVCIAFDCGFCWLAG